MSNLAARVAGAILNTVQLSPGDRFPSPEHAGHDLGVVFVVMQVLRLSRNSKSSVFIPLLKRWLLGEGKKNNFY